jgi:hypothetical protein
MIHHIQQSLGDGLQPEWSLVDGVPLAFLAFWEDKEFHGQW